MNKKLIGAVLSTFTFGSMSLAQAADAPVTGDAPKVEKKVEKKSEKKAEMKKVSGAAKAGAEKSCNDPGGSGCSK